MSKGGYTGGSTIIRPGSDWFGKPKGKRRRPAQRKLLALNPVAREAELQFRIRLAAEKLAQTQADFDAGKLKPSEIQSQRSRKKSNKSKGKVKRKK